MFLADIAGRIILAVLFDGRTTEGLVRLKARAALDDLSRRFAELFARAEAVRHDAPVGLLAGADDEIDRLFP
jgi:hypothetical protein